LFGIVWRFAARSLCGFNRRFHFSLKTLRNDYALASEGKLASRQSCPKTEKEILFSFHEWDEKNRIAKMESCILMATALLLTIGDFPRTHFFHRWLLK